MAKIMANIAINDCGEEQEGIRPYDMHVSVFGMCQLKFENVDGNGSQVSSRYLELTKIKL